MSTLVIDSGLDGLKGSVQYCDDCEQPSVHYAVPEGWPICNACGYNEDLADLVDEDFA